MNRNSASIARTTQLSRHALVLISTALVVFVLFTIFSQTRVNRYIDESVSFSYAVSSQARELQSRLFGLQAALPVIFATNGLTSFDVNKALKLQEDDQDKALNVIREKFRGEPAELEQLESSVKEVRAKLRQLSAETRKNPSVEHILRRFNELVDPSFDKLDEVLSAMAQRADQRGQEIQEKANQLLLVVVFASIFLGSAILVLLFKLVGALQKSYIQVVYRDRLFNLLSDNVDEVFFIYNENSKLVFVSTNSLRILGVGYQDFLNNKQRLFELMSAEDRTWFEEQLTKENDRQMQDREVTLTGSDKFYKVRIYSAQYTPDQRWHVVSISDETPILTYQRNLGDALENARKANLAKSQFLSHMSHEIRTPMNAIIGMTTIALAKISDRIRVEDCLKKTLQSSKHLLGLINDILDMSKIDDNKLSIANTPFNLKDTVSGLYDLINPQSSAKGVHFEILTQNVKDEHLVGDSMRLSQILINILSNAVKFTSSGGHVTLVMSQKPIGPKEVSMRFEITDTGIGISQDFLDRLFQPFEQASVEVSQKFGGSGLGMAITHNLVTLMNGSIDVKSELGKGTTFTVTLPFGVSEDATFSISELNSLRVLVVDDDPGTCEHAQLLLNDLGQQTSFALGGREAIELVKKAIEEDHPYDVCFLDWKMPDLDGEQTAKEIRKIAGPDTLIIICSAYDWTPIEESARAAGVNGFIAKPFFTSSFYEALSSAGVKKSAVNEDKEDEQVEAAVAKKKVLLVEDNAFNREVALEFLTMAGLECDVAENGQEAVDVFMASKPGQYNMIFMDVQMPVMDGLEATKKIRASDHAEAKTIPIIAMTANAFTQDVTASLNAGMNEHLTKPIDLARLHQILGKYLH